MSQSRLSAAYIYGSGFFGRSVYRSLRERGVEVLGFIDARTAEPSFDSTPILRPNDGALNHSIPVLISILGYPDIVKFCVDLGFSDVRPTEQVFKDLPEALEDFVSDGELWRAQRVESRVDTDQCAKVMSLLADDRSREVLDRLIRFRTEPSASTYPWPEGYPWYFPPDVPLYDFGDQVRVIDCGAYDGDTFLQFRTRLESRLGAYLAIEPDPVSCHHLRAALSEFDRAHPDVDGPFEVIEAAVADFNGRASLSGSGTNATIGAVGQSGNIDITVVSIDAIAGSTGWNLVKMDVEGSEHAALAGARETIERCRPVLAVTAYHKPADLWELPLFIEELAGFEYQFYLRQEGHWGLETTYYALPGNP